MNEQIRSFRVWRFRRREPSTLQPSPGAVLSKLGRGFPAQCANIPRRTAGIARLVTPSGELPNIESVNTRQPSGFQQLRLWETRNSDCERDVFQGYAKRKNILAICSRVHPAWARN